MRIQYQNFSLKIVVTLTLLINCIYIFPVFAEDYNKHRRYQHQDNIWNKDREADRKEYRDTQKDKRYYNHNRYEHHVPVYRHPPVTYNHHYQRHSGIRVFLPGIKLRICNR
ncbi:MAG: hypothetical protein HQK79_23140 [Desulfobacterales bacterium]|nr:hypothetical protein [Desulfobacterales bacterium]MBF0398306.1 hypothetical protein [Desulfobacterales bacterium]